MHYTKQVFEGIIDIKKHTAESGIDSAYSLQNFNFVKEIIKENDCYFCNESLEGLFNNRRDHIYSDRIADENKTVVKLKQDARDNYLGVQYTEELNRILKGKILKKFMGHPAHYIILSNNGDHRRMMI